jgi:hypothetical protein
VGVTTHQSTLKHKQRNASFEQESNATNFRMHDTVKKVVFSGSVRFCTGWTREALLFDGFARRLDDHGLFRDAKKKGKPEGDVA